LEGWTATEVARIAEISLATYRKAESGVEVRPYIWGKVLKGINAMPHKNHTYEMSDIR